jgi:hypothetical protein
MIVGLCGYAGAGKDWVCTRLLEQAESLGSPGHRVALADDLRLEIEALMGGKCPGLWAKPYSEGIRFILQHYGTEFRRAQDPDYWAKRTKARLMSLERLRVVTDVRFGNEAEMIRGLGGIIVEVRAPHDVRRARLGGTVPARHSSEDIDFEVDHVVWNDDGRTLVPIALAEWLGEMIPSGFLIVEVV